MYLDIIMFGYLASDIMDDMELFLRSLRRELKRGGGRSRGCRGRSGTKKATTTVWETET